MAKYHPRNVNSAIYSLHLSALVRSCQSLFEPQSSAFRQMWVRKGLVYRGSVVRILKRWRTSQNISSAVETHPHSLVPHMSQLGSNLSLHEDANKAECGIESLFFFLQFFTELHFFFFSSVCVMMPFHFSSHSVYSFQCTNFLVLMRLYLSSSLISPPTWEVVLVHLHLNERARIILRANNIFMRYTWPSTALVHLDSP